MPDQHLRDLHALFAAFNASTLPASSWDHRAHVTMAMMGIQKHGEAAALAWMRDNIRRLNHAHGLVETPSRGYHETVTRFWIWKVARSMESAPQHSSLEQLAEHVWRDCGERAAPLEYWSAARLWSAEARASWCAPDLKPLAQPAGNRAS